MHEAILAQGQIERPRAARDQLLPRGLRHVVGVYFEQDFRVEIKRLVLAERGDAFFKATIAVAAGNVVVNLGDIEAALERLLARVLPQRVFVMRDGLAPLALSFEAAAAIQDVVDLRRLGGGNDPQRGVRR